MSRLRPHLALCTFLFTFVALPVYAQNALEGAVIAKYPLTRAKPDKSDIETPGAVILLKKNNLTMYSTDASRHSQVIYKDSKLNPSGMMKFMGAASALNTNSSGVNERNFMAGDKIWIIAVEQAKDGLVVYTLSDPYPSGDVNVRYMGSVKFPFPKNTTPPPDQLLEQVSEVFSVDDAGTSAAKLAATASSPTPPAAAIAPIAPPPPPPDEPVAAAAPPPTISVGEKKADVITDFGQPLKDIKLATKEIFTYKDMKVTFVNGKVSDVQ